MPVVWCLEEIENQQQGSRRMEEVVQAVTCKWAERERERERELRVHFSTIELHHCSVEFATSKGGLSGFSSFASNCIHSNAVLSWLRCSRDALTRSQGPWGFLLAPYILLCCQSSALAVYSVHQTAFISFLATGTWGTFSCVASA